MELLSFLSAIAGGVICFLVFLYMDSKKYGDSPFKNINKSVFNIFYNIDPNNEDAMKAQATKLKVNTENLETYCNILNEKPDYTSSIARRTEAIIIIVISAIILLVGFIFNINLIGLFLAGLVIALLIAFYPEAKIKSQAMEKKFAIEDNLTYFSDLLITALRTKIPVWDALVRTSKYYDSVLSDEILDINKKALTSDKSWNKQLEELALKYDSPNLSEFISNIITASETGSDFVKVINDTSDYLKTSKLNRVQEDAKKFGTTMLFPLMIFKLLPIMMLIMIPAMSQVQNLL